MIGDLKQTVRDYCPVMAVAYKYAELVQSIPKVDILWVKTLTRPVLGHS